MTTTVQPQVSELSQQFQRIEALILAAQQVVAEAKAKVTPGTVGQLVVDDLEMYLEMALNSYRGAIFKPRD